MQIFIKLVVAVLLSCAVTCGTQEQTNSEKLQAEHFGIDPAPFDESCWPGPDYGCPELEANIPDEDFPTDIPEYCVGMYLDCLPVNSTFNPVNMYYKTGSCGEMECVSIETRGVLYNVGPSGQGKTKCDDPSVKKKSVRDAVAKCTVDEKKIEKEFKLSDDFSVTGKIYKRDYEPYDEYDYYGINIQFNWYFP